MNLLKELTEKYGGCYSDNTSTEIDTSIGKITFNPENRRFTIGESVLSLEMNEDDGTSSNGKPFKIELHLNKANQSELEIFPKSRFQQMRNSVFGNGSTGMHRKFSFRGDEILIVNIISSKSFLRLLENEKIHIRIDRNSLETIQLTTHYPIKNVEKFEKYLNILSILEKKVIQFFMTSQIAS